MFFTDYFNNVVFANDNNIARWHDDESLLDKMLDAHHAAWKFNYTLSKMYHPTTLANRTEYLKTLDVPLNTVAGFDDFGD